MKSMGNSSQREKRLAGQVSLALAAGMFSVVPVAHGMPTLDNVETGTNVKVSVGGATAETLSNYAGKSLAGNNNATTASITSESKNNVLNWKDFSVGSTETVGFDNNNYMNIVTGTATSAIDGKLTGGGDIYLINPNGVIFGKTAQVNVGNLYVSTRKDTEVAKSQFTGNTPDVKNVLPALGDSTLTADVVNLIDQGGYVAANQVVMEGRNIRFLNSSTAMNAANTAVNADASKLVLRSNSFDQTNGYIHVGDESGNYKYFAQNVTDAINTAATESTKTTGVVNYALIRNVSDLNKINTGEIGNNNAGGIGLSGNYMLADNIDATDMTAPIGTANSSGSGNAFTGKFDGMFKTVSNVGKRFTDTANYLGLFGHTAANARIENVGVDNVSLLGKYAGGVVGYADHTTLLNVWNAGGTVGTAGRHYSDKDFRGGIIGSAKQSTLKNSYNAAASVTGLVGCLEGGSIKDSYNIGNITVDLPESAIYGICYINNGGTIENVYTAAKYQHPSESTYNSKTEYICYGDSGNATEKRYVISNVPSPKALSSYAFTSGISNEGGTNTTWRIYEGASLPLLTSFMKAKGTVSTDYAYDQNGTLGIAASAAYATTENDVTTYHYPNKDYDSAPVLAYHQDTDGTYVYKNKQFVQATDEDAALTHYARGTAYLGMNASSGAQESSQQNVYKRTGNNGSAFAVLYGGQQGYDLYGNNFTINPRSVIFSTANAPTFTKVYDRTPDATEALKQALLNASPGSKTGLLGNDKNHVTLTIGEDVSATYSDPNAGTGKNVTVSGATSENIKFAAKNPNDATDVAIANNYIFSSSSVSSLNTTYVGKGTITPRGIQVSLHKSSGIDKIYDGSEDVSGTFKIENDEYTYAAKDENGKKGNIQIVVDKSGMTDAQGEITQAFKDMLIADLGLTSVTSNELDTSKLGDVTAKYVTNDGRTATANVADTAGSTNHVAYMGIKLAAGLAGSANYKFTDANGNDLNYTVANDPTSGYTFLASGTITPLEISAADIKVKTGGTLTKQEYDGESTWNPTASEVSAYTFGFKDGVLKGNDASKLTLTPTLTNGKASVKFYHATTNGNETTYTETANATASGLATAANAAGLNVTLGVVQGANATEDAANAKALQNYKWKTGTTGAQKADRLTAGDEVDTVGLAGEIKQRAVNVTIKRAEKTYDGNADVKNAAWEYVSGSKEILAKDANTAKISFTSAKYLQTGTEAAKDVAYNASDEIIDKKIQYTLKFEGANSGNYKLTAAGSTTAAPLTGTVTGRGRINRANLTLEFNKPEKLYNGKYEVEGVDNDKISTKTLTGLATGDSFNLAALSARYGERKNNIFTPNADVSNNKDVEYTGNTAGGSIFDALGANKKNYTINGKTWKQTNTVYGKGIIASATITSEDIADALDVKNKKIDLTMTYYGSAKYDKSQNGNKTLNTDVKAADVIKKKDNASTTLEKAVGNIFANGSGLTIAEAVFANENAGAFDGTAGKDVKLTFTVNASALPNYKITDAVNGVVTFTKGGYTGKINKKDLTVKYSGPTSFTKTYDGGTKLKKDGNLITDTTIKTWFSAPAGVVAKDAGKVVLRDDVTADYSDKNAASGKDVYFRNVELTGEQAKNYNLKFSNVTFTQKTDPADANKKVNVLQGVGTINKRSVQIGSLSSVDRSYVLDKADVVADNKAHAVIVGITLKDKSGLEDELKTNDKLLENDGKNSKAVSLSAGQGTYGDLSGSTFKANPDVKRDANRTVIARDVQYSSAVVDAIKNFLKTNGDNYVLDTDTKYWKAGDLTHLYGKGIINPLNIDLTNVAVRADTIDKVTTLSQVNVIRKEYDKKSTVTMTKDDTQTKLDNFQSDWWSLLDVSANFQDAAGNAKVDAGAQPVAVTIKLKSGAASKSDNYNLTGVDANNKKTVTGYGEIYARKLYASIDQPAGVPLTKIYDGTNKVKQANVNQWVKLTNADRVVSGDNVKIGTANITAAYVGATGSENDADAKDAADNKTVKFSNIGLLNNEKKNYELILKDKNGANVATLTGTDKGSLTTSGKISKRAISVTKFGNPADRNYNGDAYVTQDAINALTPTLEMELAELSADEQSTLRAEVNGGLEVDKGQLKGVYGYWDPTEASGTFQANPHVKYQDGKAHTAGNEAAKDVLYYDVALKNKGNENILKNYKLADMTAVTINPDSAVGQIVHTAYFKQAMASGKLLPLAITIDAVTEKWETPVTKVYDGNAWIASHGDYKAYDKNGKELPDAVKYLTIIYDPQLDPNLPDADKAQWGTRKVKIAYDEKGKDFKAVYEDANAGTDKVFKVSGLTFTTESLEDFIGDFTLGSNPIKNKYEGKTLTSPDDNKGAIDRRLVTVKADSVDRSRVYNGDAAIVIAAGEHYTGVNAKNNYTGFIGDDAYVTYTANFASTNGEEAADVNIKDASTGTYRTKNVVYTLTLQGGKAANYTFDGSKRTVSADGMGTTATQKGVSAITPREVYVDFKDGVDGTKLNKTYDKSSSLLDGNGKLIVDGLAGKDMSDLVDLTANHGTKQGAAGKTGIIAKDLTAGTKLGYANATANYEDANVAFNNDGKVTTKTVYIQNLNIVNADGSSNGNYVVKAARKAGTDDKALAGSGTIRQRQVDVKSTDTKPVKAYDGTTTVLMPDQRTEYAGDGRKLGKGDPYIQLADGVGDGLAPGNGGTIAADTIADVGITVESALYHDKNAKDGIGVTYTLKWDNKNYELVHWSLEGKGDIKKRTLEVKTAPDLITKDYDGNKDIKDVSQVASKLFVGADDRLGYGFIEEDQEQISKLFTISNSTYASKDTGATNETGVHGTPQRITVNYGLTAAGQQNYQFAANSTGTYTNAQGGRIDRVQVTLKPDDAKKKFGSVPQTGYTGTYTGFVNNEDFAQGALTFGRDDNRSTIVGQKYTLLGYVNGEQTSTDAPTFVNGYGNYYFVTEPNEALLIEAQPSTQDPVIADKQFVPDDYAYNRISKDADVTRFGHAAKASLQYAESGVNLDERTRSGLASSMDIEGSGSVVNLAGARMWFLDKGETPEQVAEEAALPMTEEASSEDVSSIDLEREGGETRRSSSLLEILTKASENGEDKKPSIVVNTMDEEDEDEEKESRGVVVVDRTNIAIETQGNTVNLDRMIG